MSMSYQHFKEIYQLTDGQNSSTVKKLKLIFLIFFFFKKENAFPNSMVIGR